MAKPTLLIDKTIKNIEILCRCIGINIKVEEKTRFDKYKNWCVYIFNSIWLNFDAGGAFVWFFTGLAQNKKFTELTYVSPCMTLCCLSNMKSLYMVFNEKGTDALIRTIRELEIEQKERPEDAETKKIIKYEHNYLNRVIQLLVIFNVTLLISFALSPLMLMLLKYYQTNEVELMLPFLVVYPFDPFDIRYYPWVYLRQIWSEIVAVLGICVADFIFYIFCIYLRMQLRLVGHYIQHVIPEYRSEILNKKEEIRLKLVDLIKWHQKLISSVNQLEQLYTRSTLFNFVASSILICLTGFNVMVIDDTAFVLSFLCFFLMCLLQIFFLCFFGDLLMESSMAVGDCIYNSRWYSVDTSLAKTMLIILTRAQTPCKLTASGYAEVNLKAFMKICSTAWSYFALLQTLYSGPAG